MTRSTLCLALLAALCGAALASRELVTPAPTGRELLQSANDCARSVPNCNQCRFQFFRGTVTRAICTRCETGYASSSRAVPAVSHARRARAALAGRHPPRRPPPTAGAGRPPALPRSGGGRAQQRAQRRCGCRRPRAPRPRRARARRAGRPPPLRRPPFQPTPPLTPAAPPPPAPPPRVRRRLPVEHHRQHVRRLRRRQLLPRLQDDRGVCHRRRLRRHQGDHHATSPSPSASAVSGAAALAPGARGRPGARPAPASAPSRPCAPPACSWPPAGTRACAPPGIKFR